MLLDDEFFMRYAIMEAMKAYELDEVPVGAVVVSNGRVIGKGHNLVEKLNDVTAHAEMMAMTAAANSIGGKYLNECTLYVTLEPCPMCAGAAYWTRIGRVVFGADDEKRGYRLFEQKGSLLHPSTEIKGGVMAGEAMDLLRSYFKAKR
jgi:tRNA(adenine34) deaminase